jgi:ABC-2 type transport system permease protein
VEAVVGPDGWPLTPGGLWAYGGAACGVALLLVLAGQAVFRRLEGRFAQEL